MMLIGTWDIAEARAKQWNVTAGSNAMSNVSEWTRGSPVPAVFKNEIGFKSLSVTLLVYGAGREDILSNRSMILSHLLEPVHLTLDRFQHKFYGILTKATSDETVMNRWHRLTLEFNCYEYGNEIPIAASGTDTILISNPGNITTPAIVEITPQIAMTSFTLTGICRDAYTGEDLPAVIHNLEKGKTVILDGETGLFTQEGILKDIDIWGLPALLPGENKIVTDNIWADIAVRFRPRYM